MLRVLSSPLLFSLELTPLCNSRCAGCYNVFAAQRDASPPPLSANQWGQVLAQLAPHAHRVKLTGGEPTLHPEFGAVVESIRRLGTSFTVFTNGRWLDPAGVLETLAGSPNLEGLLVSLHGANDSSHEAFSGVSGSFEETMSNVERAIASGITVTLSTVLHRKNRRELETIVDRGHALGADHVTFNRYLGPSIPGLTLTPDQLEEAVRVVDRLREEGHPVSFGTGIPQCFTRSSSAGCHAGVAFCAVDPWGNLRPCNHSPLVAGNLLTGTLEAAWRAPEMERFRNAIPDGCHNCAAFSTCHGGCRAMAMESVTGRDPLMTDRLSEFELPVLQMGRNWRPLRRFDVCQESFGLVLIRGNALLPVSQEAAPLLAYLDGSHTLGALEAIIGRDGLSFIAELFRLNLVEMIA